MVSEFRKTKLISLFNFYDTNKSGNIDKGDFDLSLEKVTKARGWTPGDAKYKEVQENFSKVWEGIKKQADADNDGEVTANEWVAMWDKFAKNPGSPMQWQSVYCQLIFAIQDSSSDGAIDSEEFSSVQASLGGDKNEAIQAFQKMSKGKASVSWPEFQELWKEYFISDDPNAPGNFIFGKTSF